MPQPKNFYYEIKDQAESPEILIYGYIGQWEDIDYKKFQNDFRQIISKHKNITIRINSGGGSVFEGLAIYDLMRSSDVHIHTIVEGMAASMAGPIALGGDTIEMTENAFFMIHPPSGGYWGQRSGFISYADLLETTENRLKAIYKERTTADEATIENWFKEGQDTWLEAEKCKELGLVDKIVKPTKARKVNLKDMANKSPEEIFNAYAGEIPNPTNKVKPIIFNMKQKLIAMLAVAAYTHNITDKTSDDEVDKFLTDLIAKAKKTDELEAQVTAIKKANADAMIANALKAGKITAAEKEEWLNDAIESPELTAKALARMSGKPGDINMQLTPGAKGVEAAHELLKGREEWTFDKWQAEAPQDLEKLQDEAPEEFQKIFDKKFNK